MPRLPLASGTAVAVAVAVAFAVALRVPGTPRATAQSMPDPFGHLVTLRGEELRRGLHTALRRPHAPLSPSALKAVVIAADRADLSEPPHVLDIYANERLEAEAPGRDKWDQEHVWPTSLMGFPTDETDDPCNIPSRDAHILFAARSDYNQSRSNLPFDDVLTSVCDAYPRCIKPVIGSGQPNRRSQSAWEVWPGRRGDVARALFYADVRYELDAAGGGGCIENDLELVDDLSLVTTSADNDVKGRMGRLSTLLRWHFEDPVGPQDRQHNEAVAAAQANRNAFTDHPEFVCRVYDIGICTTWRPRVWLPRLER